MKIAIPTNGGGRDDRVAPVFGRAPAFLVVDVDENGNIVNEKVIQNPAMNAAGGAGPLAVQTLINEGVEAIVAPQVGPNALGVIQASGIKLYQVAPGTPVDEAIQAAIHGNAPSMSVPATTVPTPAYGPYPLTPAATVTSNNPAYPAYPPYGYGFGPGRGWGRGGGWGRGRGFGRGWGRGGRGWGAQLGYCPWTGQPSRRTLRWLYGWW